MKVTVVSLARDLGHLTIPFIDQLNALCGATLRFVIVEGDSIDYTYEQLAIWAKCNKRVNLIKQDTGKPKYDSTLHPDRLAHIAGIANTGLSAAIEDNPDYVLMTPSDVEFSGNIINRLLANKVDYVAPMFWAREGGKTRFYDIWGFNEDGFDWGPHSKEHYEQHKTGLVKMKTVGGMVLINAALIAAGARYSPVDCDHGLCKAAQDLGAIVYADTTTHIYHR